MTCRYAVTYEFAVRPPLTYRGEVQGSKESTCTRLAVTAAKRALRPKGWTSMVCVLLERLDVPAQAEDLEDSRAEDPLTLVEA